MNRKEQIQTIDDFEQMMDEFRKEKLGPFAFLRYDKNQKYISMKDLCMLFLTS